MCFFLLSPSFQRYRDLWNRLFSKTYGGSFSSWVLGIQERFQTTVAIICLWTDISTSFFSPLPTQNTSLLHLYILSVPSISKPLLPSRWKRGQATHPLAEHKEEQQIWEWSCKLQTKTLEEQSQNSKGAEGKQQEESKSQHLERDKTNPWQIRGILRLCKSFLHPQLCIFAKCHWLLCTAIEIWVYYSVYSCDCSRLSLICSSPPERQSDHCHLTMAGEEKTTQGKQTCLPQKHKYYIFELLRERKNYQELT